MRGSGREVEGSGEYQLDRSDRRSQAQSSLDDKSMGGGSWTTSWICPRTSAPVRV